MANAFIWRFDFRSIKVFMKYLNYDKNNRFTMYKKVPYSMYGAFFKVEKAIEKYVLW